MTNSTYASHYPNRKIENRNRKVSGCPSPQPPFRARPVRERFAFAEAVHPRDAAISARFGRVSEAGDSFHLQSRGTLRRHAPEPREAFAALRDFLVGTSWITGIR